MIKADQHVRGQLAFEFEDLDTLGSLDEAIELWKAQEGRVKGDNDGTPVGWQFVGSGGTRVVYKSPSGICYKVCYEYDDDDETHNEVEHKNMKRIAREGKLPNGWKVPKTALHIFEGNFRRWDYHMRKPKYKKGRVVILATEFVDGTPLNWAAPEVEREKMYSAFEAVGLNDTGGANAIKAKDGTYHIVDAAEWMSPEEN